MIGRRKRHRHGSNRRVEPPLDGELEDGLCRWIDYCGGRMFVVGHTDGGAPYGPVEWRAGSFVGGDGAPRGCDEGAEPF